MARARKKEREYWFPVHKKAHNLEYRKNKLWNLRHDMEQGHDDEGNVIEYDPDRYKYLTSEIDTLDKLIAGDYGYPAARIPASIYSVAHYADSWACSMRAASCIERGRSDLLPYCN